MRSRTSQKRLNPPRVAAVFVGGFLLGHADQLSALAMSYIPVSIAYPLYAGLSLAGQAVIPHLALVQRAL